MPDTFQLEIVTPEKMVVRDVAEEAQIPGKNGYLGILYRSGASTHHLAVAWGFAEVLPDKVTILAETAERPEEIDVKRAQEARQRAEELLKSGKTEVDYERAEDALKRADTRLQVAEKKT